MEKRSREDEPVAQQVEQQQVGEREPRRRREDFEDEKLRRLGKEISKAERQTLRNRVARTVQVTRLRDANAALQRQIEEIRDSTGQSSEERERMTAELELLRENLKVQEEDDKAQRAQLAKLLSYQKSVQSALDKNLRELSTLNTNLRVEIREIDESMEGDDEGKKEAYLKYLRQAIPYAWDYFDINVSGSDTPTWRQFYEKTQTMSVEQLTQVITSIEEAYDNLTNAEASALLLGFF